MPSHRHRHAERKEREQETALRVRPTSSTRRAERHNLQLANGTHAEATHTAYAAAHEPPV